MDSDTGFISTAVPLDREETSVYYLTLVAQDCSVTDPKGTAVNLTVTVTDENDNAPQFPSARYTVHVPDHTQPGKYINTYTLCCVHSMLQNSLIYLLKQI